MGPRVLRLQFSDVSTESGSMPKTPKEATKPAAKSGGKAKKQAAKPAEASAEVFVATYPPT